MLSGFLNGVRDHVNPGGEAWLVMSNLAELVGLRTSDELPRLFDAAGLTVINRHDAPVKQATSRRSRDLLAAARQRERVSLWRLDLTE